MQAIMAIGIRNQETNKWRYVMDYEEACDKYKREVEDLRSLQIRLITSLSGEHEQIHKNIDSKRVSIDLLERWFRFTGKKPPEIT